MGNLLSKNDKEEIKKGYRKRLLVVWCWFAVAALPVFLVLVAPVYIAGGMRISEIKERNSINQNTVFGGEQVFELPGLINKKSETVIAYKDLPSVSNMAESLLLAAPSGIRVSEVSYQKSGGERSSTFRISGVAKNRETLSLYEKEVEKLPFVTGAEVPVESFSRPANLDFYMDISIE